MNALRIAAALVCAGAVAWTARFDVVAGPRPSGVVTGSVTIVAHPGRRLATAGVYPSRIVGIQQDRHVSELDNVIVFVKSAAPVASPPRTVTIRQTNEEFVPHVVAITAGSTVAFPNDDLIFHNVFSLSRAATFDLGRYPRDTSRSRTFPKPGIVKVFCHLHSHMSAIVRVFPHPYFAVPDRQGRFSIAGVPAGPLEVTAWHERAGEVTRQVALAPDATAELEFSLPLTDQD